ILCVPPVAELGFQPVADEFQRFRKAGGGRPVTAHPNLDCACFVHLSSRTRSPRRKSWREIPEGEASVLATMTMQQFRMAGVIGWPVAQSRSPVLHGHWLSQYGIRGAYLP